MEVGKPLLVNVAADVEGDTVKLRAEMIQSLEKASLTGARGIRVHADTTLPWAELSVMLEKPGKSAVHVLVRLPDSGPEVEIKIDGGRDLPPALLSRLRTLPGVESVQEL